MSAVLLAVFSDYESAHHARVDLIRDGFPTDRVELTASCEPGRADLLPADSPHGRLIQYYHALLTSADELELPQALVDHVEHGAATVTVHPRGRLETRRAAQLLERAGSVQVLQHDLANQRMEFAASPDGSPWFSSIWAPAAHEDDCIYCRLFERRAG